MELRKIVYNTKEMKLKNKEALVFFLLGMMFLTLLYFLIFGYASLILLKDNQEDNSELSQKEFPQILLHTLSRLSKQCPH